MDYGTARSRLFKKLFSVAAAFMALVLLLFSAACAPEKKPEEVDFSFLRAEGTRLVNEEGETVLLRGCNVSGYGVIEQWMNAFQKSSSSSGGLVCRDHYTTTKMFIERFGEDGAKNLWSTYQENWWSEKDFEICRDIGMNVLRLPFTYMNVDFEAIGDYANAGKNYDFTFLDDFIARAKTYGLYVILDLHGAYGSQNGKDHSGEVKEPAEVDFYRNEEMQALTVKLWKAIADRYKDEPAVAGYDILNEPAETTGSGTQTTTTRHFLVFDKIYKAIREVDKKHVVIIESCWDAANLPHPSKYGWENIMYSLHHYSGCTGYDRFEEHCLTMEKKFADMSAANFNVPVYMGEFTCYDNESQWRYTLSKMNQHGWSWTFWGFKVSNTWGNTKWGVATVPVTNEEKVNAHNDSYDAIIRKFENIKTPETPIYSYFETSGKTLKEIIAEYCAEQPK